MTLLGRAIRPRMIAVVMLLFIAAAAAPFVEARPAAAAASDCPSNHVCLYQHANYNGTLLAVGQTTGYHCYNLPILNNQVSSTINNIGTTVAYYDKSNCDAPCYLTSGRGHRWFDLSGVTWSDWPQCFNGTNDKISSLLMYQ
jgi:hypothetical protein